VHLLGRPRAAAMTPALAVAAAAALLLLVALSIALQPPNTADADAVARALAWARALLFAAGTFAFLLGTVAFARTGTARDEQPDEAEDDVEGMVVVPPPTSVVERREEERPMRFTLIALGSSDDDARAIVDFGDAAALLTAMRAWRWQFPDEELLVFGPDGAQIARRSAAPQPSAQAASVPPRLRPGFAAGSA
jgi:hypothetical protein